MLVEGRIPNHKRRHMTYIQYSTAYAYKILNTNRSSLISCMYIYICTHSMVRPVGTIDTLTWSCFMCFSWRHFVIRCYHWTGTNSSAWEMNHQSNGTRWLPRANQSSGSMDKVVDAYSKQNVAKLSSKLIQAMSEKYAIDRRQCAFPTLPHWGHDRGVNMSLRLLPKQDCFP